MKRSEETTPKSKVGDDEVCPPHFLICKGGKREKKEQPKHCPENAQTSGSASEASQPAGGQSRPLLARPQPALDRAPYLGCSQADSAPGPMGGCCQALRQVREEAGSGEHGRAVSAAASAEGRGLHSQQFKNKTTKKKCPRSCYGRWKSTSQSSAVLRVSDFEAIQKSVWRLLAIIGSFLMWES